MAEQETLAEAVGTSRGTLYQYASGHRACSAERAGQIEVPFAAALDKRWKHHTVYSNGVHYNALGNELIAGAVLTQLGYWMD